MDGILNVYKEKGYTSHDVVAKLRGILHQKKIGHTGTLDPDAVGVLPVCCGKATKVCELLTDKEKSYRAVCQLGVDTDTQDMSGTVLETRSYEEVTLERLQQVLESFRGDILQIPPMYSALKVNGKKLYELAREGKTVERKPRPVRIIRLELVETDLTQGRFTLDVTCSKGTYIRTLCHDIGEKLGCLASMESLVRTKVDCFCLEDALSLEQIQELAVQGEDALLPKVHSVDSLFPEYPRVQIREEFARKLANGNPLLPRFFIQDKLLYRLEPESNFLVYDELGNFKAVYQKKDRDLRVKQMF